MVSLTEICIPKIFTLPDANDLIPLLEKITHKCETDVEEIMKDQRWLLKSGATPEKIAECDKKVGQILTEWGSKLTKLGAKVYPAGYVALDSGSFYWSWHSPEQQIGWMHHYTEIPSQRRPIMLLLTNPGSVIP